MSIRFAASAVLVAVLATCGATSAQAFDQVIVFGDSLSDNGNLAAKFGGAVPAAPYDNGRFSNGPVAAEVLASTLGVSLVDYAYGGALTGSSNAFQSSNPLVANTGMMAQVNNYVAQLSASGQTADASALYMVWGGGNDLLSLLGASNVSAIDAVITTAVTNLVTEVNVLYAAGGRDFLVPLLPDLAYTYYGTSGLIPASTLSLLSSTLNGALAAQMNAFASAHSDAVVDVFDTPAILANVRADLVANGGNVTGKCWTGDYTGAGNSTPLCSNPDQYALFDNVHPTAVVHTALGTAMAASVTSAVPEPTTSGLMLVGLILTGIAVKKRRRA